MNDDHLPDIEYLTNNANIAIKRYKNQPTIAVAISRLVTRKGNFSFNQVKYEKNFQRIYIPRLLRIQIFQKE